MSERRRCPLQPEKIAELVTLTAGMTERQACAALGLTSETYARARGGLPLLPGSRKLVDAGIEALRGGRAA